MHLLSSGTKMCSTASVFRWRSNRAWVRSMRPCPPSRMRYLAVVMAFTVWIVSLGADMMGTGMAFWASRLLNMFSTAWKWISAQRGASSDNEMLIQPGVALWGEDRPQSKRPHLSGASALRRLGGFPRSGGGAST